MTAKSCLLSVACGLVLVPPAAAQSGVTERPVPSSVITAAASRDVLTLAAALAEAQVPGGFVLAPNERTGIERRDKQIATPWPDRSIAEAVTAFEATHQAYQLRTRGDVVMVEPRRPTLCTTALRRPLGPVSVKGPLFRAVAEAFSKIEPRDTQIPPGIMGGPTIWPEAHVTFPGGTVADFLTAFTREVPGLVWVVREIVNPTTQQPLCQFEYFYLQWRIGTGFNIPHGGKA